MARAGSIIDQKQPAASRLLLALLLSFVLHLALVAYYCRSQEDFSLSSGQNEKSRLQAVLRVAQESPLPSLPVPSPFDVPSDVASPLLVESTAPETIAAPATREPVTTTDTSSPLPQTESRGEEESAEAYLSAGHVSVAAVPARNVEISWPLMMPTIGVLRGVLTLFIDETGTVRKIMPDAHSLPPAIEAAAIRSFMATPFHPALRDGRPVKSLKRVEVVYEYHPNVREKTQEEIGSTKTIH